MLEKPSTKVGVRTMREEIAILAGQRGWNDNRKSDLARAFDELRDRKSNITWRMLKSLFYNEVRDDRKHWAAIEIREIAKTIEAKGKAVALATQLESIISGLNVTDPAFHQHTIAALSSSLRQLRGQVDTRDD